MSATTQVIVQQAGHGDAKTRTSIDKSSLQALDTQISDADVEKVKPQIDNVDYSGAYVKTDPKEIALVKKLDRWIMVRYSCHLTLSSLS